MMMDILNMLIFKTNIRLKKDLAIIAPLLARCNYIKKWTIDRQYINNVLRIVSILNNR